MKNTNIPNYRIYDRTGGGSTEDIYVESLEAAIEAGKEWIEDGDWSSESGTYRTVELDCCVKEIVRDEDGNIDDTATADGDYHNCCGTHSDELPECEADPGGEASIADERSDDLHVWVRPYRIVGGCKENPGYWSNRGTRTTSKYVCKICGCYKTEVDPGCQRNDGEPLSTITIEPRDDASTEWLKEKHSVNGYLPQWLADYLDCEDETLAHTQEQVSDLQAEAQDISHGIWTEIEEQDISELSRDDAIEWLADLTERLSEAKAEEDTE